MEPHLSILRTLLNHLGFSDASISTEKAKDEEGREGIVLHIQHTSPQLLIGPGGEHLKALEHIVRCMTRVRTSPFSHTFSPLPPHTYSEVPHCAIDINNYRKTRKVFLMSLAENAAEQARLFRKPITLSSMTSYERRIVHLVITHIPGVASESIGEEPDRRIVIKPVSEEAPPSYTV